jgi:hypothetical protein
MEKHSNYINDPVMDASVSLSGQRAVQLPHGAGLVDET